MTKKVSTLYHRNHSNPAKRIQTSLAMGTGISPAGCQIFFRADDIAFPSKNFSRLIESFRKHSLPLCLAVVPAWLNEKRLNELYAVTGKSSQQWCWHQHGVTHRNFEKTGKKQEFGPSRSLEQQSVSLKKGQERLRALLNENFFPVFTPPWNRCTTETLEALNRLNFQGISRSVGARPESPVELPEISVNVDLHTRKEGDPERGFENFLEEIARAVASGCCGVMIHHQRMNNAAFAFLDQLLVQIKATKTMTPVHFKDLLS